MSRAFKFVASRGCVSLSRARGGPLSVFGRESQSQIEKGLLKRAQFLSHALSFEDGLFSPSCLDAPL
jgi:hypothetical protein